MFSVINISISSEKRMDQGFQNNFVDAYVDTNNIFSRGVGLISIVYLRKHKYIKTTVHQN